MSDQTPRDSPEPEQANRPAPSPEIIAQVRKEFGPKTFLAFSGGKDSIACQIAMRGHFDEIIPFYFYLVPDLEFIEESLAYYERTLFGGRRIIRLPHPSLYRWLSSGIYQPPHHAPVLDAAQLVNFEYKDLHDALRLELDCPRALVATGVRAADSQMRHISMMRNGVIMRDKGEYFPVWDWKKADMVREFTKHKIKLSREYQIFGRSFDGLDARFMIPMREHFPDDYKRVLEWFPLVEADIFRFEKMRG